MEVTQFTYFQQMGGYDCKPVAGELTYGLERLAMYIQNKDSVYDLAFNDPLPLPLAGEGRGEGKSEQSGAARGAQDRPSPNPLPQAGEGYAAFTYGDVFLENERQMSAWNFEVADTDTLFDLFRKAAAECENCLAAKLPIPAYEQAIEASHIFNLLNARGVISVAERQAYIGRVRDLAKGACAAWMDKNGWSA